MSRWPRLDAYLANLPHGIDSHPDHVAKGSTFLGALADKPVLVEDGELPEALTRLLHEPPLPNAWVPEAHVVSVFKLIGDAHFRADGDDMAGFRSWVFEQNRRLLSSPLYKVLFLFVQPSSIFYGIEKRWGAFHNGTTLDLVERLPESATIAIGFAPHLFDTEGIYAHGEGLRAAAAAAGAKEPTVELLECSKTEGLLRLTWTL